MKQIFIDTVPLGSGRFLSERQGFMAREIDLPEEFANKVMELHDNFMLVQQFLHILYEGSARRDYEFPGVPEQLGDILCVDQSGEKPPKKRVTAARSKKKSPTKRKKTASN